MPVHAYRYPTEKLLTGACFGNWELFLKLTAQSDISGLWSAVDNQVYCGRWITQLVIDGKHAQPSETIHGPAYQATLYASSGLTVRKLVFLPVRDDRLQIAHMVMSFESEANVPVPATITINVHYPAFVWPGMYKIPDNAQRNKRVKNRESNGLIVSATVGEEREVRVFGADIEPTATHFSDRGFTRSYSFAVPPRASVTVTLNMAVSSIGDDIAFDTYVNAPAAAQALLQTEAFYDRVQQTGHVRTPDAVINRAIDWAKINTVRVQHRFPAGFGFTNDPSQDIVVTRDAAWYVMGSDYLTPEFSRGVLELIADHGIEAGGKITEYINACADPPTTSDYDLNINDDTPLIVSAVYHHYAVTRDRAALERMWPMVHSAIEWLLAQMRDGLIYSDSIEANVWGISGWRNIIPQGQISGAVTEINAECVYALRLGGRLARLMGESANAERYASESEKLKANVNTKLISERTGMYLLNIDPDGVRHHDLTGDQIFPVLFGVADRARKRKILDLLYKPEFWTPFGVRTVGKHQEEYDPDYGIQLLGGVWPNLTAWVGYSGKNYSPRRLVSAMRNIWKISEVDNPRAFYNVVPGLFPERLSGDSFKSRGMAMSPWMPPTYLWLTYEGLLGFEPLVDEFRINPHLPDEWSWVGAREVPVMGGKLSLFYYRRRLHATMPVVSRSKCDVYDEDVTRYVESDAPFFVAMRSGRRAVVFVATDVEGSYTLRLRPPLTARDETANITLRAGGCKLIGLHMTREPADADALPAVRRDR